MIENHFRMEKVIRTALEEDLGSGDITTDAIIGITSKGAAVLKTREKIVLAGLPIFCRAFELVGPEISFDLRYEDGASVEAGETICNISGSLSVILKTERTALNFLQRMSGIATLTREYVLRAGSDKVKILDTRKTAPGLNLFDKYSVRMGGGFNHRFGLYDGILIKDNHIIAAGSIKEAVILAKKNAPHTVRVEVEVEDLSSVKEAIETGADAILLDNMSIDEIRQAVELVNGRIILEASGGITLENISEIARTGVDLISVGALTHSVRAVDLSLEVISRKE